jgi:PPOX class probable F420-dependent enzyme
MELEHAVEFAKQHHQGVLATIKKDGRPQLSNIIYGCFDDGTIRISATADRSKAYNLWRDPRASLHVDRGDFWGYVVLECDAFVSETAAEPDDAVVDDLVELYRHLRGEHPNWDDYRRAMVAEKRCLLVLTPTHAYGMLGE